MPIVLVLVGLLLLVTAYNNTFGTLTTALGQDVPGFAKWGVSLGLIGALGYIPGMQTTSRWLLALVGLVLVVQSYRNNQNIFQNIANAVSAPASAPVAQADPTSAIAANPASPQITQASISGTPASSASATSTAVAAAVSPFDPNGVVNNFMQQAGVSMVFDAAAMGFGGVA